MANRNRMGCTYGERNIYGKIDRRCICGIYGHPSLQAQTALASLVVFDNLGVFIGSTLTARMTVLIEGNHMAKISAELIGTAATATHIAGGAQR